MIYILKMYQKYFSPTQMEVSVGTQVSSLFQIALINKANVACSSLIFLDFPPSR